MMKHNITIKELRILTKMTQQEFANYLQIPLRTIQNWEGGQRIPATYITHLIEYKLRNEKLIN